MLQLSPVCVALWAGAFQTVEKLNAPLARDPDLGGGQVSTFEFGASGARLLFAGDPLADDDFELWSVPFSGGLLARLSARSANGPFATFEYRAVPARNLTVYWTDQDTPSQFELFVNRNDGGAAPARLHPPFAAGRNAGGDFALTADAVVYRADANVAAQFELFRAPLDGSAPPVRLSDAMVAGGSIGFSAFQHGTFALSPALDRAWYLADARSDGRTELFSVPVDGSSAAVRLNGNLPSGGQVHLADQAVTNQLELYSVPAAGGTSVRLSAVPVAGGDVWLEEPLVTESGLVVYRADALDDDEVELFAVPADGSAAPLRLNAPMPHAGFVLEAELVPGGARVIYKADQTIDDEYQLWSVPSDASAAPVALLGAAFMTAAQTIVGVSATRALCQADRDGDGDFELYSVPVDASAAPLELAPAAELFSARLSPDGTHALFVVRAALDRRELHGVLLDGSTPPVLLSPPLPPGGQVVTPAFRADGAVAFLCDARVRGQFGLWSNRAGALHELTPELPPVPFVGDVSAYAWAPDGASVLYGADRFLDGHGTVTRVDLATRSETFTPPQQFTVDELFFPPRSERFAFKTSFVAPEFPHPASRNLWSAPLADASLAQRLTGDTSLGPVRFTDDERAVVALSNSGYRIDPEAHLQLVPLDGSAAPRELAPPTNRPSGIYPLELTPRTARALFGLFDAFSGRGHALYAAPLDVPGPAEPLDLAAHADPFVRGMVVRSSDELVLFVSDLVPFVPELFTVPADGSRPPQRLLPPLPAGREVKGELVLSPDGARVLYLTDARVDEVFELVSTRIADGASVVLSGTMVAGGGVVTAVDAEPSFRISPDGARVVFLADRVQDDVIEFWSAPLDGSAPPVRLHAPLSGALDAVPPAHFTPDGTHVVLALERAVDGVVELVAARTDGSGTPIMLNAPFPPGGGVFAQSSLGTRHTVALAPGGRHVFYLAEQETDGVVELFGVPLDGSSAPRKRSAPLVAGGNVVDFVLRSTPGALLYRADQEVDETFELFLSSFPDEAPPHQGSAAPGASVTRTVDPR
jgi:hypothetical protein